MNGPNLNCDLSAHGILTTEQILLSLHSLLLIVSSSLVPLEAPLGVGVEVMNSTAVKVKWAPVNTQSVRGHLLGYKVQEGTRGVSMEPS